MYWCAGCHISIGKGRSYCGPGDISCICSGNPVGSADKDQVSRQLTAVALPTPTLVKTTTPVKTECPMGRQALAQQHECECKVDAYGDTLVRCSCARCPFV